MQAYFCTKAQTFHAANASGVHAVPDFLSSCSSFFYSFGPSYETHLRALNPFLSAAAATRVEHLVVAALLKTNRVSHAGRAIDAALDLLARPIFFNVGRSEP